MIPTAHRLSRYLILAILIIVPVATLWIFYNIPDKLSLSPLDQKEYPFDISAFENGYQVGSVIVTLNDLEESFSDLYAGTAEDRANIANWQVAADSLSAKAALQSQGLIEGIYGSKGTSDFNVEYSEQAKQYFNESMSHLSGEAIVLWFQNDTQVNHNVAEWKTEVLTALTNYQTRIEKGEIQLAAAAEELSDIERFSTPDPNFPTNIYKKFENITFTDELFQDESLTEKIWMIPPGTISEAMIGKQYNTEASYEAFYTIVKIHNKDVPAYTSAQDVTQEAFRSGNWISLKRI